VIIAVALAVVGVVVAVVVFLMVVGINKNLILSFWERIKLKLYK
jgi:hypothetical protein